MTARNRTPSTNPPSTQRLTPGFAKTFFSTGTGHLWPFQLALQLPPTMFVESWITVSPEFVGEYLVQHKNLLPYYE